MTYDTSSPTGIALSQDEKILYVADNGLGQDKRELRAYPIQDDGTLGSYIVLHTFGSDHRGPHWGISGMCLDSEGHIIACAGSEKSGPGPMIYIFAPSGQIIETHPISERPTKCAFGDEDLSAIYVTTERGHLYRVRHAGRRGFYPPSFGERKSP
jgi:gluconolactonase